LTTKMLASTVQFSSYGRSRSPPTAHPGRPGSIGVDRSCVRDRAPGKALAGLDGGSVSPRSDSPCGASGSLRTQQRAWITSSLVHVSGCTQLYFLERLEVATEWSVFHP